MTRKKHDLIDIQIEDLLDETDLAFLVLIDGEEIWFPKSQVELNDTVLTLPEWLAREKGLG